MRDLHLSQCLTQRFRCSCASKLEADRHTCLKLVDLKVSQVRLPALGILALYARVHIGNTCAIAHWTYTTTASTCCVFVPVCWQRVRTVNASARLVSCIACLFFQPLSIQFTPHNKLFVSSNLQIKFQNLLQLMYLRASPGL